MQAKLRPPILWLAYGVDSFKGVEVISRAGPYIAHLESQYSWAQIRLAAYILGSRPSAQVPEG